MLLRPPAHYEKWPTPPSWVAPNPAKPKGPETSDRNCTPMATLSDTGLVPPDPLSGLIDVPVVFSRGAPQFKVPSHHDSLQDQFPKPRKR
eukprot:3706049-Amphidinium_carterae.1